MDRGNRRCMSTANWTHVEDGKVTEIKVAFDARELAP
jgi:hypothetical protein